MHATCPIITSKVNTLLANWSYKKHNKSSLKNKTHTFLPILICMVLLNYDPSELLQIYVNLTGNTTKQTHHICTVIPGGHCPVNFHLDCGDNPDPD